MKWILTSVLCFLWMARPLFAQTTFSDCSGAIELCDDFYEEEDASLNTGNVFEFTGTCNLNVETSSVWYTFTVQSNGSLSFILNPNNINDDYDWGLFNITNGGCEGLGTTSPEVSCNSWGSFGVNGATGISSAQGGFGNSNGPGDLNGPPFNSDLNVFAGQTYALVVMNWTNSFEGYSIDFSGSTATLYDQVPPIPVAVDVDCTNTSISLTFSEPILTSSVQALDFEIEGPSGPVGISSTLPETPGAESDDTFILTFDGQVSVVGNYSLTITTESGLVEDACGNLGEGTVTFTLVNPLAFETELSTACNGAGGSIALVESSGGVAPITFRVNGTAEPDGVADDLAPGSYNVSIEDATGCVLTEVQQVGNHEIDVFIPEQDTVSCVQPQIVLTGLEVTPEQSNLAYEWSSDSGTGIVSGGSTPSPRLDEPGIYSVVVTHLPTGCQAAGTIEIAAGEILSLNLEEVVYPNVVTPNGDDLNETWYPYLASDPELDLPSILDTYDLKVFNRWGGLVHESGSSREGWDPGDLSDEVYHYVLKLESTCGEGATATREGYIQVLR